jgi:glyceraldehyde 3-phosphate dehydrogenase
VDIVFECTGIFTNAKSEGGKIGADAHILRAGAKKVIISAPAKGEDLTIVLGVNEEKYDSEIHHIISNASCTTNCLAPAAKIVNDRFGIISAVMTTIHSYTNDQVILDQGHKKEMRRSRAAGLNIIPTSTGAAKAVSLVIPELKGKFDGYALRVPTPTVSIVDFVALVEKPTTKEELNAAFTEASQGAMKGILGVTTGAYNQPLVSSDFKGDSRSSIVDLEKNMVMNGNLVKVVTWYDNEWGYSCRAVDLGEMVAKKL